jgi:dTDP-4-dehydrorhamnose reductase
LPMNILVFGKDGQLGKAFQNLLHITAADLSSPPHIDYIGRAECDLANEAALRILLDKHNPNLIINAAAYTAVDKAEIEVEMAFAINAKAPEVMASYAVKQDATFLHYSTDYVFDGEKYGFYLEEDQRNPLGIYGKSKAAGEEAITRVFTESSGKSQGQFAIFRTSWVYGEGANFIRTILRLAKERDELKIIDDQYGVPTGAQWLAHVSLALALNDQLSLRKFPSGIYHAVPAGEVTWYSLACLAVQTTQDAGIQLKVKQGGIKPILVEVCPLLAPRPMNSRMWTDKLRRILEQQGNMSKLDLFNQSWDVGVKAYVSQLVKDGLI